MSTKAGFYTDKDGAEWLRLGNKAVAVNTPIFTGLPECYWEWSEVKERWGPMTLDHALERSE